MLYMDLLRFIYLFIFSLEEKETDQQEIIKWSVKEGVKELFTVRIKGGSSVMKMMTIVSTDKYSMSSRIPDCGE